MYQRQCWVRFPCKHSQPVRDGGGSGGWGWVVGMAGWRAGGGQLAQRSSASERSENEFPTLGKCAVVLIVMWTLRGSLEPNRHTNTRREGSARQGCRHAARLISSTSRHADNREAFTVHTRRKALRVLFSATRRPVWSRRRQFHPKRQSDILRGIMVSLRVQWTPGGRRYPFPRLASGGQRF